MGAIPPSVLQIQEDLDLSAQNVALIGVTPFFVNGILTIFMPFAMRKFEARTVLVTCQILNTIGALMVALLSDYRLLITGRFLNGVA